MRLTIAVSDQISMSACPDEVDKMTKASSRVTDRSTTGLWLNPWSDSLSLDVNERQLLNHRPVAIRAHVRTLIPSRLPPREIPATDLFQRRARAVNWSVSI